MQRSAIKLARNSFAKTRGLLALLPLLLGAFPLLSTASAGDQDPNTPPRLLSSGFTVSLSSYIEDYITYIKEKPDDWYARLPRDKQDLIVSALRSLAKNKEIKTGFSTEQPLEKDCIVIKAIRAPRVLENNEEGRLEKFSLKLAGKGPEEVELKGSCLISDGGSTVEHKCAIKGMPDIAYVRYKLTLSVTGGGLDLKEVTVNNRKKYIAKFKP